MNRKLALLVVSVQLGLLVSAHAASDRPSAGSVTTVGTARPLDIVRGSGTDVPLAQALAAIVPRDFTIRTTAVSPAMLNQPASWTGGRPWTDALLDMLEPYPELVVDVSLGARLVIVRQVPFNATPDGVREAVIPPMQQGLPNNARPAPYVPAQTQPLARSAREQGTSSIVPLAPAATTPMAAPASTYAAAPAAAPAATQASTQAATQAAIQAAAQAAIQTATQAAIQSAIQAATLAATQAAQAAEKEAARTASWDIRTSDKTIRSALSRWAASSGWQLSWELSVDYPVYAQASFSGQFETAVESVVKSLEHTEVPVRAVFYRGNRVLRLIAKGVQ
jgi:hypothetical protein